MDGDSSALPLLFCGALAAGVALVQWDLMKRRGKPSTRPMPRRIVLIRHGESMGNFTTKDKAAYRSTPDHLIPLTDKGHFQARGAGERLKALLDKDGQTGGKVKFFCSPHLRTKQTLEGVLGSIPEELRLGAISYDNLLREIDRGFFGEPVESVQKFADERKKHGHVHYRFPGHDSVLDVMQRVTGFLCLLHSYIREGRLGNEDTIVIVGHHCMFVQLIGRLQALTEIEADDLHMPNCSVSSFERYTFDGDKTNGTVAGRDVTRVYSASRATHEELGSFGRSVSEEQARGVAQTLVEGLHTGLVFIN